MVLTCTLNNVSKNQNGGGHMTFLALYDFNTTMTVKLTQKQYWQC